MYPRGMPDTPPRRLRTVESLKALTHPIRRSILAYLGKHGSALSTTLAEALGENTGTLSYHLRQLERYGYIEDVPDQPNGRERWWRQARVDWRAPEHPELAAMPPEDQAVFESWARAKLAADLQELSGFVDNYARDGRWAQWSRAGIRLTVEELQAFNEEYLELVHRYARPPGQDPPEARQLHLRFYAYPAPEDG